MSRTPLAPARCCLTAECLNKKANEHLDEVDSAQARLARRNKARSLPATPACGRADRHWAVENLANRESDQKAEIVSCTCAVDASSCRAMSGSDGERVSAVSGPTALKPASRAVSAKVPGRSMCR
jgi:hypothetical protein